ncbi:uncharacterized protein LOC118752487 [Rhagoletis pomonella]|uniref:uncharacterized protein LOC118752487 n=1 Tax=Rhagoletis pomonella TaxID=28610 RepID=UPI00177FCB99|nr:uncharacterized protein LOC118752487 [Rhagoletis pomonella]
MGHDANITINIGRVTGAPHCDKLTSRLTTDNFLRYVPVIHGKLTKSYQNKKKSCQVTKHSKSYLFCGNRGQDHFVCPLTFAGAGIFTTATFSLVECSLCILTTGQDHLCVRPRSLVRVFSPLQPFGLAKWRICILTSQDYLCVPPPNIIRF